MEMVPQAYPLYAAARWAGNEPTLCMVIGWKLDADDDDAEPVLIEIGETNLASVVEPGAIVYIGPDRSAAQACVTPLSATQKPVQRGPLVRYARGATALCGLLNAHERHIWTPDGHDYAITCTGGTP